MPAPEIILWQKIRAGQLNGIKFRRQYSIGKYIVDFYCSSKKLVIEIDGDSHYGERAINYDNERQTLIGSYGIKIIRFTNEEIMKNIEGVLTKIVESL